MSEEARVGAEELIEDFKIQTRYGDIKTGDLVKVRWIDSFFGEINRFDVPPDHPMFDDIPRITTVGVWICLIRNVHIMVQDWLEDGRRICYIGIPNGTIFEIQPIMSGFIEENVLERIMIRMGLIDSMGFVEPGRREIWV